LGFLPILILAYPLLEIAVLIMVGSSIGVFATIGLIIGTGILGAMLLRFQGFALLTRMRSEINAGRMPEKEMADGAMIAFGGVLLMIPGFISDVLGILLFIPQVRGLLRSYLGRNMTVVRTSARPRRDGVVDLDASEYQHTDDDLRNGNGNSPWRLPSDKN
jgi:UPF0716 protein FxsA